MPLTLKERLSMLYTKGYRFCIQFAETSNIEPLAVKTLSEIGPLMRNHYANEKNWRGWEFDADGVEVPKNTRWKKHGTAGGHVIWTDGEVYQATTGPVPGDGDGGYPVLESLLNLKGLKLD